MARGHGRISSGIWEDEDFLALGAAEQRLYLFLISQSNLNHAGLLPLTLRRWARKARGLIAADLEKQLQALAESRFIVLDLDTEELLIRSFVRNDGVWKQPKVMGAMVSGAMEIESRALRVALLAEMDRIPLDELSDEPTKYRGQQAASIRAQVAEHIATLRAALTPPSPPPSGGGSATPSEGGSATPIAGANPRQSDTPSNVEAVTSANVNADPPTEGGPEGVAQGDTEGPYARGRGRALCARSPAPTPTPVPSPIQDASAEAGDQSELIVVTDSDFVGATEPASASDEPEPVGADTIVAEWLDRCAKRPPGSVVGRVGSQIKKLVGDGIDADDIRAGIARWMAKGADPSAIPSFVNQAMNSHPAQSAANVVQFATGQPLPGTDTTVAGWAALATPPSSEDSA